MNGKKNKAGKLETNEKSKKKTEIGMQIFTYVIWLIIILIFISALITFFFTSNTIS